MGELTFVILILQVVFQFTEEKKKRLRSFYPTIVFSLITICGNFRFRRCRKPIILARSTDYRSNFFRHSKLRKSVKTAEKANLAYSVNAFRIGLLERIQNRTVDGIQNND